MVCTVTYYYIIYIYIHKSNNVFKGREKRERFYYRVFLEFSSNILFLSPQFLRASFAAQKYPLFYTFNSLLINQRLTDLRNRTFGIHSSTFKYITLLTTKSPLLQPFDIWCYLCYNILVNWDFKFFWAPFLGVLVRPYKNQRRQMYASQIQDATQDSSSCTSVQAHGQTRAYGMSADVGRASCQVSQPWRWV